MPSAIDPPRAQSQEKIMKTMHPTKPRLLAGLIAAMMVLPLKPTSAADIDIYGPTATGTAPNVVFLLDNTSNWSTNNQNWNAGDEWTQCKGKPNESLCQALIKEIYYTDSSGTAITSKLYPWEDGYKANKDNVELTQGQVQLRALRYVLNKLVCNATTPKNINVGTAMIGTTGSVLSPAHATGFINFAVQKLEGTSCTKLIDNFKLIDSKITDPTYKAPSNANYGAALFEIFKYYGGYTNPTKAYDPEPNGASPTGPTGYGPIRFSISNPLDDPKAFTDASKATYKSPITAENNCGANYVVLVGNTYPNAEAMSNGGPTIFKNDINYTPPSLDPASSDTSRLADEWAAFLANTDVSSQPGVQRVTTFAINTFKDKPSSDQEKLLKSMARYGGAGGYYQAKSLLQLVDAFEDALVNIAAVNSVFSATTLPVSTTTQGAYLNQIFVGMFRPDPDFSPRWFGNLKQYQLAKSGNDLILADSLGKDAVSGADGLFSNSAVSYWTSDSVFFSQSLTLTPSDRPDGPIVEKGGAAQRLREANLHNSDSRNIYTLSGGSLKPFLSTNIDPTVFTNDEIAWIRGENNVPADDNTYQPEDFNGSYKDGETIKSLGSRGARHSIHGDVLHSRPVALSYNEVATADGLVTSSDVMVFYGANDGFFRAINGNQTGGGQEVWSFIAPEHYDMLKRLRKGKPVLHLPETDKDGALLKIPPLASPKPYGMDGSIGVFANYERSGTTTTLKEAIIYPTMRRGGRSVYAFNVSSKNAPEFLWKITGGKGGDFDALGQTWSMPKAIAVPVASKPVVLVMGGGYDPLEDENKVTPMGNAIFIINGRDGTLIKKITTEYSVPSDVTLTDVNRDGLPDRAYVADVKGNLYRIDLPEKPEEFTDASKWPSSATKIATLGGKVFYPPDVVVTPDFVAVLLGTGDREKPLMTGTSDRFVLVKDNIGAAIDTVTATSLPAITTTKADIYSEKGCRIELGTGEKVINAPFTIAGVTYFGTNTPKGASNRDVCTGDLGIAQAYRFPLFCGVPQKTEVDSGGMLPSPVGGIVMINIDGKPTKVPFLIGGGKDGSVFAPELPKPDVKPIRTRLYWRIDNKNR
jgi:type IV pilus assembly protein PilY1